MNEYPIYTDEGKLFFRYCYQEDGVILRTKNGEIPFHSLVERLSLRHEAMTVREKQTAYGKEKRKIR